MKDSRQCLSINTKDRALNLDHRARGCGAKTNYQGQPNKAFLAHQSDFHTLPSGKTFKMETNPTI